MNMWLRGKSKIDAREDANKRITNFVNKVASIAFNFLLDSLLKSNNFGCTRKSGPTLELFSSAEWRDSACFSLLGRFCQRCKVTHWCRRQFGGCEYGKSRRNLVNNIVHKIYKLRSHL